MIIIVLLGLYTVPNLFHYFLLLSYIVPVKILGTNIQKTTVNNIEEKLLDVW